MVTPMRRANIASPKPQAASMHSPVVNVVPYTRTGTLATSQSPAVTPANDMYITGLSATLRTAGTTNTVVELQVNGTSKASVTLSSGQTYGHVRVESVHLVARTDAYNINVTSAGTGASDLGGEIEYHTPT